MNKITFKKYLNDTVVEMLIEAPLIAKKAKPAKQVKENVVVLQKAPKASK